MFLVIFDKIFAWIHRVIWIHRSVCTHTILCFRMIVWIYARFVTLTFEPSTAVALQMPPEREVRPWMSWIFGQAFPRSHFLSHVALRWNRFDVWQHLFELGMLDSNGLSILLLSVCGSSKFKWPHLVTSFENTLEKIRDEK